MSEKWDNGGVDFFVAGGTLRYNSPSYVKRPADDDLLQGVMAGDFCYVLTPRQMGKSSLMVRTSRRLRADGVHTAILDLTAIGTEVTAEQWYLGLISRLAKDLRLRMDVQAWWEEHASLGVVHRFSNFLQDQVLGQIDGQIVVFVDEIDVTLNIPFSDDFFVAIRAFYNARADDPAFDRLSFVLLGVATPADLIKDRKRTPFNIGQRIELKEFSRDDASILRDGVVACYPQQGQDIFDRIYFWTNGHPYLTQRLCLSAAEQGDIEDVEQWVDLEVDKLFLAEAARRETNLQFIREYMRPFPQDQQRQLLDIYGRVHRGQRVVDDERSISQNHLKLVGLVKDEAGYLVVRNEIYGHVFDEEWIKETRPVDWNRRIAIIAGIAVFFLAMLLVYIFVIRPRETAERVIQEQTDAFRTGNPAIRLRALAQLFEWDAPGTIDAAINLMNDLEQEQRIAVFTESDVTGLEEDIPSAVFPLTLILPFSQYATDESVPASDPSLSGATEDDELLVVMAEALERSGSEENLVLANGIKDWLAGRQAMGQGNFVQASINLSDANSSRLRGNPALLYDIALVSVENDRYEEALADMSEIMALKESSSDYSKNVLDKSLPFWQRGVGEIILAEQELYGSLWENSEQYPELIGIVPSPTPTPTSTPTPTPTPCTRDLEILAAQPLELGSTGNFVPINSQFPMSWTLHNTGSCSWPAELSWAFVDGEDFGYTGDPIPLGSTTSPGESIELEARFTAPGAVGTYESTWQLIDADGSSFGPPRTFTVRTLLLATDTPRPTSTSVVIETPVPSATIPPASPTARATPTP